jgi:geranylgeranyl diphosphate synthase type I
MVPRFARPELQAPLSRVARRVEESIEVLRPYGRARLWDEALACTLAICRATTHLLRAQLVLLGSLAGGGLAEGEAPERFAAGLELHHLFMLVHDDVMDNASLRRGQPTLRVALTADDPTVDLRAARDLAIVMGNLLEVQALRCFLTGHAQPSGEARATALVLEGSCRAGAGQFHDLLGVRALGDDEEALRRELVDKTAYHGFVSPLGAGLLLASPEADPAPALTWGSHFGLAFQGTDDLADLVGSPATTGKDGLRDLLEGRASLPLFFLRRRTEGSDRELVDGVSARHSVAPGERAYLDRLVRSCDLVEASAAWVRAEVAAAARAREAAGFSPAASQGLAAIEQGLLGYLASVVESAAGGG